MKKDPEFRIYHESLKKQIGPEKYVTEIKSGSGFNFWMERTVERR